MHRRTFLTIASTTTAITIAGCSSDDERDSQATPGDTTTPDEVATADDTPEDNDTEDGGDQPDEPTDTPAQQGEEERNAIGFPSAYIEVRDVEYNDPEDDWSGPTITGAIDNTSGEELSYVEVSAQAFNSNDEQIDDALDNTTDLRAEKSWRFEMEFWEVESKSEIAYWMGRSEVNDY